MGECTTSMGAGTGGLAGKATHERDSTETVDHREFSSDHANSHLAGGERDEQSRHGSSETC